jgi:hypothetical protein
VRYKVKNGMEKGTIIGKPMESRNWWTEPASIPAPPLLHPNKNGKFNPNDPDTSAVRRVSTEWSVGMRSTKICVFDASSERKTIRKFNEAFLSGCVVASDIPSEMESLFRGVVIELDARMSEAEIDGILRRALSDPVRLQEMAVEALRRARRMFSCKNKVDKLLVRGLMLLIW